MSLLDRYYSALAAQNREAPCGLHMAVIAVLMSAKLEQFYSPSFKMMIQLLPDEVRSLVTKPRLINLETDIVKTLEWDV